MSELYDNVLLWGGNFKVVRPYPSVRVVHIGKEQETMEENKQVKTDIPEKDPMKFDFGHGDETVDDFVARRKAEREKIEKSYKKLDKALGFVLMAAVGAEIYLVGKFVGQKAGYAKGLVVGQMLGERAVYSEIVNIVKGAGGAA